MVPNKLPPISSNRSLGQIARKAKERKHVNEQYTRQKRRREEADVRDTHPSKASMGQRRRWENHHNARVRPLLCLRQIKNVPPIISPTIKSHISPGACIPNPQRTLHCSPPECLSSTSNITSQNPITPSPPLSNNAFGQQHIPLSFTSFPPINDDFLTPNILPPLHISSSSSASTTCLSSSTPSQHARYFISLDSFSPLSILQHRFCVH